MKDKSKRNFEKIWLLPINSVFTKLLFFTASISLIPIIFVSVLLLHKIERMVTDELANSHSQIALQYTSNLEDKLNGYRDSLKQIANNTIISDALLDIEGLQNPYVKGKNVSIEVNKYLPLHKELLNCIIYSNVEDRRIQGKNVTMMKEASLGRWYSENTDMDIEYFTYPALNGKGHILSLIENIENIDIRTFQMQRLGVIKLDIVTNQLFAPVIDNSKNIYPYDVIVLNKENSIIYSSNHDFNNMITTTSPEQLAKQNNRNKGELVNITFMEEYGFKFIFLFDDNQLFNKKIEILNTIIPILILVLLFIIIIAYAFAHRFSKRVEKLVQKIKVAETGDLTIAEEIKGNDEIAVLDKQFNRMLIKLDQLIHKNYIQQLEKKETKFRNLQLQINPHFLYNTLETISSIAAINQTFIICELCEKLGDIFRYSLGKNYGEFVTVKQELQHIQNYIYIQSTRYRNKFEVFYNVGTEVQEKLILRFILQPIVENAILHGLSPLKEKGTLEISISQEDELLIVKVEDDGIGMPKEKIDELIQYCNFDDNSIKDKSKSIGIRNVNQRIKLMYGVEYGISIESTQGHGSCFTILLPFNQKGGSIQ